MHHMKATSMTQCGREITPQELEDIQETVKLFWRLSRAELAKTICENLEWFTASGGYKVDACMKLLEILEKKGLVRIPEKRSDLNGKKSLSLISLTARTEPQPDIVGALRDVAPVELEVVSERQETELWKEYMFRYHYLKYKKPFGCHLRYFIKSEQGILGCVFFAGAAKSMKRRDRWIGWTENQRLKNMGWVINNTRFLIFPWVRIRYLASHVLGQIARRIGRDWQDRWGYEPFLMETFVDPQRYEGSCYKASNWQYLGMTTGEGLVRVGKSYATTPKMIFVKPLVRNFGELLCSELLAGKVEDDWAQPYEKK